MTDRLHVWHATDGWRWRRVAPNGDVIAESGEAYTRKQDAEIAAIRANEPGFDLEVDE